MESEGDAGADCACEERDHGREDAFVYSLVCSSLFFTLCSGTSKSGSRVDGSSREAVGKRERRAEKEREMTQENEKRLILTQFLCYCYETEGICA